MTKHVDIYTVFWYISTGMTFGEHDFKVLTFFAFDYDQNFMVGRT